jgi:hypothetical protein
MIKQETIMDINTQPQLPYNNINPKAFSNQEAIVGMYGTANPGTFTRTVGNNTMTKPVDMMASQDAPIPPPAGIQTPITPNYDLNY